MFEIFSWLPVKLLYKLSVLKEIRSFLSEDSFVEKQCYNSSTKTAESLIIQNDSCLRIKDTLHICFLFKDHTNNGVPIDSLKFITEKGRVLASSNGLILCRTINSQEPTKLFLCNPVSKTWLPITLPNNELAEACKNDTDVNIVFICGSINFSTKKNKFPLDYTLLVFEVVVNDLEYCWNNKYNVYMLEEGDWVLKTKKLITGGRQLDFDNYVCFNGGLYFMSISNSCYRAESLYYYPYIVYYNMKNEASSMISLPHEARENFNFSDCYFRIFGWERLSGNSWFFSLCLVKYLNMEINIWVMDEGDATDGEKLCSWRWLLKLNIKEDLGLKDALRWTNSFTVVDKQFIFSDSNGYIYQYQLEGINLGKLKKINKYKNSCYKLRFNSYSTTLRPCSKNLIESSLKIE